MNKYTNLTKGQKILYVENLKILLKEIKDIKSMEWKPCSWVRRHKIVTMPILPKVRSNVIPIKTLMALFCRKGKIHPRILKESQET